jgi:hypothetical protein
MDKYERHNEKQKLKYFQQEWQPWPTFISPATFDIVEREAPHLLEDCMVSLPLRLTPEEQVAKYSVFAA